MVVSHLPKSSDNKTSRAFLGARCHLGVAIMLMPKGYYLDDAVRLDAVIHEHLTGGSSQCCGSVIMLIAACLGPLSSRDRDR